MARLNILPEMVQCRDRVLGWEEAIRISARPLLEHGYIREPYVDEMIATVKELGPYIVIAPMIAMPHARSGNAVRIGMAVLKLEEPVSFGDEADATLILPISVIDSESHLAMLQTLACLLSDEELNRKLLASNDPAELLELLSTEISLD